MILIALMTLALLAGVLFQGFDQPIPALLSYFAAVILSLVSLFS